MGRYRLIEFYIKGLDPRTQRKITGALQDLEYYDRYYAEWQADGFERYIRMGKVMDQAAAQLIISRAKAAYLAIDGIMQENNRAPLFSDVDDLGKWIALRKEYLSFFSEEACAEKLHTTSFSAFIPPALKTEQ